MIRHLYSSWIVAGLLLLSGVLTPVEALDDFKCYHAKDLKDPRFVPATVSLSDQLGINDGDFKLKKPFVLCDAADKNEEGLGDPDALLTCYKVVGPKLARDQRPRVEVTDQFGTLRLEVKNPFALCVPSIRTDLHFQPLADHIGDTEEVALNIYFVGFPASLESQLRDTVQELLSSTRILDAKPWWIPNIPKYGEADFATAPAPPSLPAELTPPDGLIRYDSLSMTKGTGPGGEDRWLPNLEIEDMVNDWQRNNDVINNVNHDGALVNVPWVATDVSVQFLPPETLTDLYAQLDSSKIAYTSTFPSDSYTLYSYNELMDWLDETPAIEERIGGATIVFLNLATFAGTSYTFYGDPNADVVPSLGNGPASVQFPPVTAGSTGDQSDADLMTLVLGGSGLTQAKMLAALDIRCNALTTAALAGISFPGMETDQSLCGDWKLVPIRNLLGNKGRRYFVSDATDRLGLHGMGGSTTDLLQGIQDDLYELYRFGVLQQTIKANNVYSEAYELRTLVFDLRYDAYEACLLDKVAGGTSGADAKIECVVDQATYESEKTYAVSDVFDAQLAADSLNEFNPGDWDVTFVDHVFGLAAGTVDSLAAANQKRFFRTVLDDPSIPVPGVGLYEATHPPLYRKMQVLSASGDLVEINSTWEKGLDLAVALNLLSEGPATLGLGIYDDIWPEATVVGALPYHKTGQRVVKPQALILTPPPDGPLGEKWGAFPSDNQTLFGVTGSINDFGSGGWWVSVSGNEEGGAIQRRDFSQIIPQYYLGKHRANGSDIGYGVMPDGTVQEFTPRTAFRNSLEIGAPHWCDEFDSVDVDKRTACRNFVRTTTTLQAIETLQHGLGYMHAPEPRHRYHYDGQFSTVAKLYELLDDDADHVAEVLHRMVNMYTTIGVSNVWGQCASDWNGAGPQTGMQLTMHRSHLREEMAAAEAELAYAIEKFEQSFPTDTIARGWLKQATDAHATALQQYDDWAYRQALSTAMQVLSFTDRALTSMGEPNRIYDPTTP